MRHNCRQHSVGAPAKPILHRVAVHTANQPYRLRWPYVVSSSVLSFAAMYRVLTVKSYIFSTLFIAFICCLYALYICLQSLLATFSLSVAKGEKPKIKWLANDRKMQQNGWIAKRNGKMKREKKTENIYIGIWYAADFQLLRRELSRPCSHRDAACSRCVMVSLLLNSNFIQLYQNIFSFSATEQRRSPHTYSLRNLMSSHIATSSSLHY